MKEIKLIVDGIIVFEKSEEPTPTPEPSPNPTPSPNPPPEYTYTWGERMGMNVGQDQTRVIGCSVPAGASRIILQIIGTNNEVECNWSWVLPDGVVYKPFDSHKISGTDVFGGLGMYYPIPEGMHLLFLRGINPLSSMKIIGSCV